MKKDKTESMYPDSKYPSPEDQHHKMGNLRSMRGITKAMKPKPHPSNSRVKKQCGGMY